MLEGAIDNMPVSQATDKMPEVENLVGLFALLLEVDKRIGGKPTV